MSEKLYGNKYKRIFLNLAKNVVKFQLDILKIHCHCRRIEKDANSWWSSEINEDAPDLQIATKMALEV